MASARAPDPANSRFGRIFLRLTEPLVFRHRRVTLACLVFATLFFAYHASQLKRDAGFEKQLASQHEYTQVFRKYQGIFGGSTRVLIALVRSDGDIYETSFLEALRKATDEVFFLPGVNRASVTSLFTPNVRYAEPQEGGTLSSGNVVPPEYAPTAEMAALIRANVRKTAIVGRLVSLDQRGAMIWSELLEFNPSTGEKLDYVAVSNQLEDIRGRFMQPRMREYRLKADHPPLKAGEVVAHRFRELGSLERDTAFDVTYTDDLGQFQVMTIAVGDVALSDAPNPDYTPGIDVHIIGFAKAVGDVSGAAREVIGFFALTVLLILVLLWAYCGSLRIAALPLACALVAVIWELGLLHLFGFGLDPYAILVPFLIVALGVSHGVQITNFWLYEMTDHGLEPQAASLATFRRLVIPGLTALLTNIVGFATLLLVPIDFVREMAWNACFGCVGIIVAKKILLPILLSYARVPDLERVRDHQRRRDRFFDPVWAGFSRLTELRYAVPVLLAAGVLWAWAGWKAASLTIGELRTDVAELRPDSRYNLDAAAIDRGFIGHRDVVLSVIAETHSQACIDHQAMEVIDDFAWHMSNAPGVQNVRSLPQVAARINSFFFEGDPKWRVLPRNQYLLAQATGGAGAGSGLANDDCSAMPVNIYLRDHRAETIEAAIAAVKAYGADLPANAPVTFALASGNVGLLAASNEVVRSAERTILLWVYAAIALCVWVSFRSVASVICILLPLALVSVLAYAVMVELGIGLKPITLPIAALAAGIGVDYGIYIYSVLHEQLAAGLPLRAAYQQTLHQTGKAVVFTGLALTASVATWLLSELQFQADMGALLALMFLGNMLGAVMLLPACAWLMAGVRRG